MCGLYFSYATTPPGNAILEKIKRMKHIHLTTEVYLITVENCTEKVRTKLAEENIEWLNLEDFVSSIYYIIKIDKIVSHFLGVGYLCEGKIGLSELYDLFKIYSEVKIESQFEDATKNFDKELILRSRKSKNRYLQYLKRKFATNPFQDGDSFDTTVKKFQNICKLPLSIELPFYNYDEFEKMNSSEPYDYRSPNPYRKQKRESVIL